MSTLVAQPPAIAESSPDRIETIVSWEDIRRGVPGSSTSCALARAFWRIGYKSVQISLWGFARVRIGGHTYRSATAANWMCQFDRNKEESYPERFVWTRVDA